jgi:hypothetical protein
MTPASQVMVLATGSTSRQHDLAVERDLAADQAGIAALRHDRRLGIVRQLDDGGDFRKRARPQHQRRGAVIEPALLGNIGRDLGRCGDRMAGADDRGEAGEQIGIEVQQCGGELGHARFHGWLDRTPIISRTLWARYFRWPSPSPASFCLFGATRSDGLRSIMKKAQGRSLSSSTYAARWNKTAID